MSDLPESKQVLKNKIETMSHSKKNSIEENSTTSAQSFSSKKQTEYSLPKFMAMNNCLDLKVFFKICIKALHLYSSFVQASDENLPSSQTTVAAGQISCSVGDGHDKPILFMHPSSFFVKVSQKSKQRDLQKIISDAVELGCFFLSDKPKKETKTTQSALNEEQKDAIQENLYLYMAPEYLSDDPATLQDKKKKRSREIYAFGVLCYKLLTSLDPFLPKSTEEKIHKQQFDVLPIYHLHLALIPPPITCLRKDVPQALNDIIQVCCFLFFEIFQDTV